MFCFENVLIDAASVGVQQIMVTGASVEESIRAIALCAQYYGPIYPQLFSTCGMHPHHANQWQGNTAQLLLQLAQQHPCVKAIGETGLDFYRDISPRSQQELAFIGQLEIASQLRLPLFLHERDAYERFAPILTHYRPSLTKVVVHCFTGDHTALSTYLDLDCYIGITGWICDERRGQHLQKLVRHIPLNRLMIETDAPYLLPRDLANQPFAKKTRRNEPQFLPHIARILAHYLNLEVSTVCDATFENSLYFFGVHKPASKE
jgi:TatD DNase family protein